MPAGDALPPSIAPVGTDDADRTAVEALLQRAGAADDHPALSESALLAFRSGRPAAGLLDRDDGRPVGYAQVDLRGTSAAVELVVDPALADVGRVRAGLLGAAVTTASGLGADAVRYWVNRFSPGAGGEALALGFSVERDLLQLRVPLPLEVERRALPPGCTLRPFRPGEDEDAWLEVNNRAFAAHPEQGNWDRSTLVSREGADWFDPAGFILCEKDGRLAGSCWTKVHAGRSPVLGEIYVISIDPDFQGAGLGRALAVAGMDWLAERAEVGMLYVDGSNSGAVELYRKLGFTLDHVDRCYLLSHPTGRAASR